MPWLMWRATARSAGESRGAEQPVTASWMQVSQVGEWTGRVAVHHKLDPRVAAAARNQNRESDAPVGAAGEQQQTGDRRRAG